MATRSIASNRFLLRDMGSCLKFNDKNNLVFLAQTSFQFQATEQKTYMGRFFPTKAKDVNVILNISVVGAAGFQIYIDMLGGTQLIFQERKAYTSTRAYSTKIKFNQWNHFAVVFDGVAQTIKLYINGELLTNAANLTWANVTSTTTSGLLIGGSGGSPESFTGLVDDMICIDGLYTTAQVLAAYYCGVYPGTKKWWVRMNEGTGSPVETVGGYTGTLTSNSDADGAPSWSTNVSLKVRSANTKTRYRIRDMGKSIFCRGSYGNPRVKPTDDSVNTIGLTSSYSFSAFLYLRPKTVVGAAPGADAHCLVALDFDYAANKGYVLEITTAGAFSVFYGNTENRGSNGKFPFGKWVHLAMVVSGTSVFCYIDGVLVDTRTIGRVVDGGATQRMFFAETASSTNRGLFGFVDEVWVKKDYVLSLTEIQKICFNGVYPSSPSLLYLCDDTSGNLTDSSGNANTGLVQDVNHLKVNQSFVFLKARSSI